VLLEAAEPGSAGAAAAWALAVLGEPMILDGVPYRVGASVGVAVGRAGDDRAGLLRRADLAMYAAKARGKSTYEVYQPWMADRAPGFLPTALPAPDHT
jgi:GGDEF domain-containing protein